MKKLCSRDLLIKLKNEGNVYEICRNGMFSLSVISGLMVFEPDVLLICQSMCVITLILYNTLKDQPRHKM